MSIQQATGLDQSHPGLTLDQIWSMTVEIAGTGNGLGPGPSGTPLLLPGTKVLWTINGQDWPGTVRGVSDCGQYVLVEESTAGLPIDQVRIAPEPDPPGPAPTPPDAADADRSMIDRDEVARALPILFGPDEAHEIRALPSARGRVLTLADLDQVVDLVAEYGRADQVYCSLNPVRPDAPRASNETTLRRAWLFLDVDARKAHELKLSATAAEKEQANLLAGAILEYLLEQGWPPPLLQDSGNGWYLRYRIDLPNDEASAQLLKDAVEALADRFDNEHAHVDRKTRDAARIAKVPGTWARKGPDLPERPHRKSRIQWRPETLEVVPVALLEALAASKTVAGAAGRNGQPPRDAIWNMTVGNGTGSLDAYVRRAVEGECGKLALAIPGNRNNQLNESAFRLATMAGWPELDANRVRDMLLSLGEHGGLPRDECIRTINSGWTKGAAQPRPRPAGSAPGGTAKNPRACTLEMISSADLCKPMAPPEWRVKGVLLADQPGVMGGPGKTLKTSLLVDLTVSLGTATPFLDRFDVPRACRVGLISGESGRYVIRANALQMARDRGVNLARASNIFWGFDRPDLTADEQLKLLEKMIRDHGLQVLSIDPLYMCVPADTVDHKNMFSFGPVLANFGQLCLEAGCLPILAHHFTKSREDPFAPPELIELAYGGISQWARQWMLVSRREKYAPGVPHKLHWVHGGSFGHSGELSLDIDTGTIADDFSGRKWDVTVTTPGQVAQARQQDQDAAKVARRIHNRTLDDAAREHGVREDMGLIRDLLGHPAGIALTVSKIRQRLNNMRYDRCMAAIEQLLAIKAIMEFETMIPIGSGARRKGTVYKLNP